MRNVRLVARHEIVTILGTRSFWVMALLFPALIMALTMVPQIVAREAFREEGQGIVMGLRAEMKPVGYVDLAGIVRQVPGDLQPALRAFADEAAARAAMAGGELEQYYIIPADYVTTGNVVLIGRRITPLADLRGAALLERAINANLLGDPALAALVADPAPVLEEHSSGAVPTAEWGMDRFAVPFAVMFLLFMVITISGGFMLQSVTGEKQSRMAEVLLVSLPPRDLMMGKLIGLGAVGLLQMAVWAAGSLMLFRGNWATVAQTGRVLSPGFLAWCIAYFLLGYVVYASALGALGALAPGMREGSQLSFIILMPLLLPVVLNSVFIDDPNGALATVLSLFPLTSPTSMPTRLAAGLVPGWQPIVGLLGLAVTAYLFVLLAARFFSAETLLSGAGLDWRRIIGVLRRQAPS